MRKITDQLTKELVIELPEIADYFFSEQRKVRDEWN